MPSSPSGNSRPSSASAARQVGPFSVLAGFALGYSWLIGNIPDWERLHNSLLNTLCFPLTNFGHAVPQTDTLHGASLCLFKNMTHLPCLFCGLTRSFILIGQGQWAESWHYHPMGLPLYGIALLLVGLSLLNPNEARKMIAVLSARNSLMLALILFSACWLWKLGQNPRFW